MFGRGKKPTLEEGIRRELEEGEFRRRPLQWYSLPPGVIEKQFGVDPGFWDFFSWLPVAIECNTIIGWTVDATDRTYVEGYDSPVFGRHFDVYFNNFKMGRLQVTPAVLDKENYASVSVSLARLNYLPYHAAHGLLRRIILLASKHTEREADELAAEARATGALTEFMWEAMRLSSDPDPDRPLPLLEFHLSGPFEILRLSIEHWAKHNVSPEKLTEWRYRDA